MGSHINDNCECDTTVLKKINVTTLSFCLSFSCSRISTVCCALSLAFAFDLRHLLTLWCSHLKNLNSMFWITLLEEINQTFLSIIIIKKDIVQVIKFFFTLSSMYFVRFVYYNCFEITKYLIMFFFSGLWS